MPTYETNREVTVEKWIYGGDSLGRIDGRVVLTPFAIPGETLQIQVEHARPDLMRASIVDITTPSPERVEPECKYFGSCGGCHYQHANYAAQLANKVLVLRDVLKRIAKMDAPAEIATVAGGEWRYRNRIQLHFGEGQLGYLEAGSRKLRAIDTCPVASPKLEETIGVLREMMRDRRWPRFVRTVEIFTNENDVQVNVLESEQHVARRFFDWCAERLPGAGLGALDYPTANGVFRVSHRSFFQVNRFLIDALVETALGDAAGTTAWDLYAGVGLFAVPLAKRFQSVTAVENGFGALADAECNAQRASVKLDTFKGAVEDFLDSAETTADFVIADPPRAGLGKRNVQNLLRARPKRLVVVACDPATLARDMATLIGGGYKLERLALVDLFPQTYHFETVATLALT